MMLGVILAVVGGVLSTVVAAALIGAAKWGAAINRAVIVATGKLEQLAEDVRELAAAAQDTVMVRAELRAHVAQADERWRQLGGLVPHPRYVDEDNRPRVRA